MQTSFLGSLLHLSDPTLPIGGYTHSNGLETYVQKKNSERCAICRDLCGEYA